MSDNKTKVLTVIMRDDNPWIHVGGSPTYRSVHIVLTEDQAALIAPRWKDEEVDRCFIETKEAPDA